MAETHQRQMNQHMRKAFAISICRVLCKDEELDSNGYDEVIYLPVSFIPSQLFNQIMQNKTFIDFCRSNFGCMDKNK